MYYPLNAFQAKAKVAHLHLRLVSRSFNPSKAELLFFQESKFSDSIE